MILLLGIPSEAPLRLVIEAAESQKVPYVLFNQRESQFVDLYFEITNRGFDGTLRIHAVDWPLSKFTGVYARMMDYHDLPENQPSGRTPPDPEAIQKSSLLHEALFEWLEITPCSVMNRNSAMTSNLSKPYQAQAITRVGFQTPVTIITNDPDEVRDFLRVHRRVVFKSISSVRSIVRFLSDIKIKDIENVRYLPTQFQEFIPGTNIRVHVVGEQVFATEINTEAVDYRYASRDDVDVNMAPVDLPMDIEERCLTLSKNLSLPLCGIDLKRTPEGEYYCFEVNPSPGYSYYQSHTGQDIASAIVQYLSQPAQDAGIKFLKPTGLESI
jgi:hypothetical protein